MVGVFVGFGCLMVRWNGERQALRMLLDLAKNIQNSENASRKTTITYSKWLQNATKTKSMYSKGFTHAEAY